MGTLTGMSRQKGTVIKMDENKTGPKKETKKKIIIFFVILAAAAVLLPLINMIDFDALVPEDDPEKETEITTLTLGSHHFLEPDYEKDIMLDEKYLKENRYLHYTYDNETFEVDGDAANYGNVCVFFDEYFKAVISGDYEKYNLMFTDEYIEKYGEKTFTQQKIYNINVECIHSDYLKDGDAKGKYKGYYVYYFDVSYNIMDNDGTFRNDFLGDEGVLPLVFEVIEGDGKVQISSISVYQNAAPGPVATQDPYAIYIIAFAILLLLLALVEVFTRKLVAVLGALSCGVGIVLSVMRLDIGTIVIAVLVICATLVLLRFTLLKKFIKKFNPHTKNAKNPIDTSQA